LFKGETTMAPRLNYVGQTPTNIDVDFAEMPTGAHVAFVNVTSAAQTPSPSTALNGGGSGSAAIPIESGLIAGQYYLLAQDSGDARLAQTVNFFISTGDSGDL
jgi:hypothetical protein